MTDQAITFSCTLKTFTTDQDGETKLILMIPYSEKESVKRLQDICGENVLGVSLAIIENE
jgi:hypothetical protein